MITNTYRGYLLYIHRNGEVEIHGRTPLTDTGWERICDELDRAAAEKTIDRWIDEAR